MYHTGELLLFLVSALEQPGDCFRLGESLEGDLGHDVGWPAADAAAETGKAQRGGGEIGGLRAWVFEGPGHFWGER